MKRLSILCLASAMLFTVAIFAQMRHEEAPPQQQGMQRMGANRHREKMQSCETDMQHMQRNNAQVRSHIEEARRSNNPASMQSALSEADQALAAMDNHISGCLGIMNMKQDHHQMPPTGASGYLHE